MNHRRAFLSASLTAAAGTALGLEPLSRSAPKLKLSLAAYSMRNLLPNYRGGKGEGHEGMQMSDFLDVCAKWDLDGAELTSYFLPDPCPDETTMDLRRKAHVLGLDISGGAIGNNFAYGPGEELDKQMAYTTRWIETYAKMGAPVIRVFAGHPKGKGTDAKQAVQNIITNLKAACNIAAKHGVILAMENHDFTTDIDRYLEILQAVDSPWFGANLDTGNLAKTDDPYRELARIAPYTVNAQLKVHIPVNGKREPADFPRLIQILKDANYRGFVVLEYEDKEDPMLAIPSYLETLRKAMGWRFAHQESCACIGRVVAKRMHCSFRTFRFSPSVCLSTCLLLLGFHLLPPAGAQQSPVKLELHGEWGASSPDIHKVLQSAAAPLWRQFPDRDLAKIDVHAKGGPIVLYRRGKEGSYSVKLNTGGTYWSQYAYQFSHEFCHIVCNYRAGGAQNKWFEEAIAEMGSLYSMRQMASDWAVTPPYPNWKSYASSLKRYAQDLIDKTEVPKDLAGWYQANKETLTKKANERPLNRVVSCALLPQFEKNPELWQALAFINQSPTRNEDDFAAFLRQWHQHAPRRFGEQIEAISMRFGVSIDP